MCELPRGGNPRGFRSLLAIEFLEYGTPGADAGGLLMFFSGVKIASYIRRCGPQLKGPRSSIF
jgi:hypothetical protein